MCSGTLTRGCCEGEPVNDWKTVSCYKVPGLIMAIMMKGPGRGKAGWRPGSRLSQAIGRVFVQCNSLFGFSVTMETAPPPG
jgi:hypothetical protein